MGRFGAPASEHIGVGALPEGFRLVFLGRGEWSAAAAINPYLSADDLDRFRTQRTTCIAVHDGDRIAASTWMTSGEIFVTELRRVVSVAEDQHFSCRTYVDPSYRGQALMSHMIYAYAERQPPTDVVWGFIYLDNLPSIASVKKIGWRRLGTSSTTFTLGIRTTSDELISHDG